MRSPPLAWSSLAPVSNATAYSYKPAAPFQPQASKTFKPPQPASNVQPKPASIRERFDQLIADLRAEFKDRFGHRTDWTWSEDYLELRHLYWNRLDRDFALPPAEAAERRRRIDNVIELRLQDRRQKAIQRREVAPEPGEVDYN